MKRYDDFIRGKQRAGHSYGLETVPKLNRHLYDWQREITAWALERGRAAIFADCGLGKTLMQLAWAHALRLSHAERGLTKVDTLILTPLAVAAQTCREAERFGIQDVRQVRQQSDVRPGISVANYEMLHKLDTGAFEAVVLDESSILKAFTGKTKQALVKAFDKTAYRLCCTATPAPNDVVELGNHCEFLGVLSSREMLSRWFVNDTMCAGNYRIRGWAHDSYWRWVSSWAASVRRPSDLGYSDAGFELPELNIVDVKVDVDIRRVWLSGELFPGAKKLSATNIWREKRQTMDDRVARVVELVAAEPDETWLVWCDTNAESDALTKAIDGAVQVKGSHKLVTKESRLRAFSEGVTRVLVTKPDIAGHGLNWQHCARQVFVGVTYSFERFYQAVRRCWRYGQTRPVDCYVVYAETEGDVVGTVRRKHKEHEKMHNEMRGAMKKAGLMWRRDVGQMTTEEQVNHGNGWSLVGGDCVTSLRNVNDDHVGLTVFSPPFTSLYIYSDKPEDMGNCTSDVEFFEHFAYLLPELYRVTKPGRLCCVHCKDLPLYMNRDGAAGLYDFPGRIVAAFEAAGWTFHSRVTIWKDPVIEMQRTKNHGLLHKNFRARREVCRQGMADFVLVFRAWKDGQPDKQITHDPIPGDFIGGEPPKHWDSERDWSIQTWQKYASPVWFDIRQTNVLEARVARDHKDEKHICPLQLDVIERCIWLWSNPDDCVLSPFAGIGSEGYVALKMKRQFIGVELKESYYRQALVNLQRATSAKQHDLFATLEAP